MSLREHVDGLNAFDCVLTLDQEVEVSRERRRVAGDVNQRLRTHSTYDAEDVRMAPGSRRIEDDRVRGDLQVVKDLLGFAQPELDVRYPFGVDLGVPNGRGGLLDSDDPRDGGRRAPGKRLPERPLPCQRL